MPVYAASETARRARLFLRAFARCAANHADVERDPFYADFGGRVGFQTPPYIARGGGRSSDLCKKGRILEETFILFPFQVLTFAKKVNKIVRMMKDIRRMKR